MSSPVVRSERAAVPSGARIVCFRMVLLLLVMKR